MEHTQADQVSLGAKLDALELSDGERELLHAVFDAAIGEADDEVAGFAQPTFGTRIPLAMTKGGLIDAMVHAPSKPMAQPQGDKILFEGHTF